MGDGNDPGLCPISSTLKEGYTFQVLYLTNVLGGQFLFISLSLTLLND
jgi:hypothetical protein